MNPTGFRLPRTSGVALLLFLAFVTWQFLNRWNRIVRLEESVARPLEFDYYSGPAVSSAPHGGRLIGSFHNFLEWWFRDREPKPPIHGWTVTYGRNSPNRLQAACGPWRKRQPRIDSSDRMPRVQRPLNRRGYATFFDFARDQEIETRDRPELQLPYGSPPRG